MAYTTFILINVLLFVAMLLLLLRKTALSYLYMTQSKKHKGEKRSWREFFQADWKNVHERQLRLKAFLLFPLFYPILLDDKEEVLLKYKREIKRINVLFYLLFALLVIMGIFAEKFTPNA